jgi:hypothetical protein
VRISPRATAWSVYKESHHPSCPTTALNMVNRGGMKGSGEEKVYFGTCLISPSELSANAGMANNRLAKKSGNSVVPHKLAISLFLSGRSILAAARGTIDPGAWLPQ